MHPSWLCSEPRRDQEQGGGAGLLQPDGLSHYWAVPQQLFFRHCRFCEDSVQIAETAISEVQKLLGTGGVSTSLTPLLPWCHFKKTTGNSAKFQTRKPFFSFLFFALACERIIMKMQNTESGCYRTGKCPVCRHVPASFSPEIVQARAVKGLTLLFWQWLTVSSVFTCRSARTNYSQVPDAPCFCVPNKPNGFCGWKAPRKTPRRSWLHGELCGA